MRNLFYGLCFLLMLGCNKPETIIKEVPGKNTPSIDTEDVSDKPDTTLYIMEDSIIIVGNKDDSITYSRYDFNTIVRFFPELYREFTLHPDQTYSSSKIFVNFIDSAGYQENITFGSEVGQDDYYILYAYFLKKKNGIEKYKIRRKKLIELYTNINNIIGLLNYGGTYFGHQYRRIPAFAEYSIYCNIGDEEFYTKKYSIAAQKKLYIESLKQFVKDEMSEDVYVLTDEKLKKERADKFEKYINSIDHLITDYHYLKCAQGYQHSKY